MSRNELSAADFIVGERYNWKNQPERLIYMGTQLYPNGIWHQFAKVEALGIVWSEVRSAELAYFEKTINP